MVRARKQAFCLRDDIHFNPATGPAKYNCDFQGLSPGWEDMYPRDLDCQWLDVTGVPGGTYLLRVTVNPEQIFEESNYANNTAQVSINLPVRNPPPPQPSTPAPPPPPAAPKPAPKVTQPQSPWKQLVNKAKAKKKLHKKKKHKPQPPPKPAEDDKDDDHESGDKESGDKA